jgi:uncharacterized repeat protein (TIGR02543 family)
MKLQTAKCTVCGASLKLEVDKTISECAYCKSQIIVSNALDFNKVEVDKSKDIIKYRDNLKKYVRNNSIEEILRVSNQILDILPKDFLASYFAAYAHQVKGEPNYIYEFYSNILEHTPDELEEVVEHINKRSDLRDDNRIIKFLSNTKSDAIDNYKIYLKHRIEQEDNYADIERDVFICCSSKNEDVVKDIVTKLENDGHTCWVYYRNIRQDSKSYLEDIEKAVKKSNIFLLVSSSQAVASKDVNYEISLARDFDKPRLEFKIDTSERNTNIKDFYKGIKWIDGSKSIDDGINNLLVRILELKNQPKKSNQTTALVTKYAKKKSNKLALILGAGVLALALLVGFSLTNRADTAAPVIQLSGSASMSLNQGDIYNEPGAIVSDNVDIGLDSIISGNVNTNVPGTYTIKYNAIDNAGNRAAEKTRTVTVRPSNVDSVKPVIRLNGDSTITLEVKSAFTDPLASVSDNKDINVNLITSGVVNSGVVGTYTLRYNAIDNAGNRADEVVRTVRVVDTIKPVVTLIGSSTIRVKVGETYTEPGMNVSDNYDLASQIQQTISGTVNISTIGTYTLTYSARDSSGNTSTPITRQVIVETNSVDASRFTNATTFVTLDINPSIGLTLNNFDQVLEVYGINNDGVNVIAGLNIKGQTFNNALTSLIQSANTKGYVSSTDAVLIGIESNNESKRNTLETSARSIISTQANNLGKTIATQVEKTNLDVTKAVSIVSGLTPSNAKIKLINDVSTSTNTSYNSNATLNIKQLIDRKNTPSTPTTPNQPNAATYTITYILNSGTNPSGAVTAFNATQLPLTLPVPTRTGFNFQGWYESSTFTGNPITQIPFNTTSNKAYFARWAENNATVLDNSDRIIESSLAVSHSAILTNSGRVFIWGSNFDGRLGNGSRINSSKPIEISDFFNITSDDKIVYLSLGGNNSAVISNRGKVFIWGGSYNGLLGSNDNSWQLTPLEITEKFNLIGNEKIIKIVLGYNFSLALSSLGRVFSWGGNSSGELGDGTFVNKLSPVEITKFFTISSVDKIIDIKVGGTHSAALTALGKVFIWGNNYSGQLGDGSKTNRSTPLDITNSFNLGSDEKISLISLGQGRSAAITDKGKLFFWGSTYSQGSTSILPSNDITKDFTSSNSDKLIDVVLGDLYAMALTESGKIFGWGLYHYFNPSPTNINGRFKLTSNDRIIKLVTGENHRGVLTESGRLFLWGYNEYGELGTGTAGTDTPTELKEFKK